MLIFVDSVPIGYNFFEIKGGSGWCLGNIAAGHKVQGVEVFQRKGRGLEIINFDTKIVNGPMKSEGPGC